MKPPIQPLTSHIDTLHEEISRMAKFYDYLPLHEIVATLSQQLSWSNFVEPIKIEEGEVLVSQSVMPSRNSNAARFSEHFRFRLTQSENEQLITDCNQFAGLRHSTWLAFSRMKKRTIEILAEVKP